MRADFEAEALVHLGVLYGTALRLTRNERDAEDLVQETALRAYRFWHRYKPGTNCKAWMFRILHNTFVTRYHKRKREQEIALAAADEKEIQTESVSWENASHRPEFSDAMTRALDSLQPEFRMAVILCDLHELSYKEIAAAMDCPVGTVMSRLHRGRKLLQQQLREHAVEQGVLRNEAGHKAPNEAGREAPNDGPIDLGAYRAKVSRKTSQ